MTDALKDQLDALRSEAAVAIGETATAEQLEAVRIRLLGRKEGRLT